ncbi:helix-turn-helix domain-containing protein [Catenulispora rubra]|uniref:helix-turn-helix domain-containing protein n=1 Tax=Catenulispora rubra TaxID=280293 RepID=UPI0018925FF3|nr:LuxR C-terminal-related transcriptional regulator [Catenulispora rubra]
MPEESLAALLARATDLVARLESLLGGESNAVTTAAVSSWAAPVLTPPSGSAPGLKSLTAREHVVLSLLVAGMSNRRIARALGIAEPTVKNHLRSIFRKLGVQDRTQAVARTLGAALPGGGSVHSS